MNDRLNYKFLELNTIMKKKPTLDQLHVESVALRLTLNDEQLESFDFDKWFEDRGWTNYEFNWHLEFRRDLIEAQRRFDEGNDDE